jgi:hypothetical protein
MPDENGITLAEAKTALAAWMMADAQLAGGAQEYRIITGTTQRVVRRADAAEVTNKINFYQKLVHRLSTGGGIQVRGVTFLF